MQAEVIATDYCESLTARLAGKKVGSFTKVSPTSQYAAHQITAHHTFRCSRYMQSTIDILSIILQ
jgi:hypothetical protein